jgi:hypothetical protein
MVTDWTQAIGQLACRLDPLCERRVWAEDAPAYNERATGCSAIETVANFLPEPTK